MAKRKIRLTESQLIDLIKKSLLSEDEGASAPAGSAPLQLDDSELREYAQKMVDHLAKDVTNTDFMEIQSILEDNIFGKNSKKPGKCAYKELNRIYAALAASHNQGFFTFHTTGAQGSLLGDLENASIESDDVKKELIDLIKKEEKEWCKQVAQPAAAPASQPTTQTNKFYCLEGEDYQAYGPAGKQYAEKQWKGGVLSFYLDGTKLGDSGYPNDNILYQKGGKKWTTEAYCSEGGPGKPRGLEINKPWNPKK